MNAIRSSLAPTAVALLLVVWICPDAWAVEGVEPSSQSRLIAARLVARYEQSVEPLLNAYCHSCHGSDTQEAGVRIDVLDANMIQGADAEHWSAALDMINQGEMPPDYDSQPSDEERRRIVDWLTDSLDSARKFGRSKPAPQVRRLTREQYTNSLAEILHLPIDFGRNLPAEAKSLSGFTNSGSSLFTSALHADYYQSIARAALDKAIVTGERPQISRYRVTIGKGIGRGHRAARIGGFQSAPIPPRDILVEVLDGQGEPVIPRSVQESQRLREIEANIGIGMRGSSSDRYRIVEEGMVLYSALPHKEQAPKSWQGPSPNLKMLLRRCFPTVGPFKTRVVASLADTKHYQMPTNGLIELRSEMPVARLQGSTSELMAEPDAVVLKAAECRDTHGMVQSGDHLVPSDITKPAVAKFEFTVAKDGYYQIELVHPAAAPDAMPSVSLHVDDSAQHLRLKPSTVPADGVILTPITHARLPAGRRQLEVGGRFFVGFREIVVSPLPEHHPASSSLRSEAGEVAGLQTQRPASLRAFLGNRTDDGMEYAEYHTPRTVDAPPGSPGVYEFSGYLDDLPAPLLDEREKTSLSNIMIVGVWNDCLVKDPADDGRPILVKSIEFEAPFYAAWPPKSHSAILFDSPLRETDEDAYTRKVIARFMARAFRREASDDEIDRYYRYWTECRTSSGSYVESVKDVLTAVLCSPHFLYLSTPERFQHGDAALAERLSYFLWNSPPDEELNQAAAAGELVETLPEQVRRMIADPRVMNFVNTFAKEWLRLDRHLAMSVNVDRYPDYTRFVKRDMALETTHFVRHVLQNNLSLLTFIDSDFAMLNQNLAEFYGIKGVFGGEFRAVAVQPELRRGGLVSQGAFLTGHSDGSQAHPIKRAVWLKSELLNSPPPPPPPNVPELNPETPGFQNLTLKQQLELHRDKASCADCHRKIDPFGVALENYDAVGRHQVSSQKRPIDSTSKLPDGTLVSGVDELKAYLLDNRREDVARSVVAHLLAYALGRDLTFADDPLLERVLDEVASDDYRLQTAVQAIVKSVEFSSQSLSVR